MGIIGKLFGGNTLYYPGCLTKFVMKDLQTKYKYILEKCGIDFIRLKDVEMCCGSPVLNTGYTNDFKTLARKNLDIFKKHSIKKIITSCPACYKTFHKDYKEILGDEWDIEVDHAMQTIANALKSGRLKVKKLAGMEKVTYHDPCHLGRHSGIYDEPREILKALGYEIVEMENNRGNASCCGGGGGVKSNYPELSGAITKDTLKEAKKTKAGVLVTACPMCDACFLQAAKGSKMNVKELSEILVNHLI